MASVSFAGWIPFTEKLYYCSTENKLKMWPAALARRLIAAFWRHSNLMSGVSYAHRVDLVPGVAAVSYFVESGNA
jgi:hypothetical protein